MGVKVLCEMQSSIQILALNLNKASMATNHWAWGSSFEQK